MLVRLCNRCTAPMPAAIPALAVNVPKASPATQPGSVTADPFAVQTSAVVFDMQSGDAVDLCALCLASTIVELAAVALKATGLTTSQAQTLGSRFAGSVPVIVVPGAVIVGGG